ncbi:MAG: hypothetical protein RLZZ522_736 [Verrucomicrobiota bacterium]
MVAVLGCVLPMAGAPLRYCLCVNNLLLATDTCDSCCKETPKGCCEEEHQTPTKKDCMVSVKLLPDAVFQGHFNIPAPVVTALPPAVFSVPVISATLVEAVNWPRDRGPPLAGPPRYLRHCSLLL